MQFNLTYLHHFDPLNAKNTDMLLQFERVNGDV